MDDELARHLARVALRVSRDLQEVTALLKDRVPSDEYSTLSLDIASVIHTVMTILIDKPLASRPDLLAEIEGQIEHYGRYL